MKVGLPKVEFRVLAVSHPREDDLEEANEEAKKER